MDHRNRMRRRSALAGMAAVASTIMTRGKALGSVTGSTAVADNFIPGRGSRLTPFPMTQVRLLNGPLMQQADFNEEYLASLSTDRLLHSFRLTAGITDERYAVYWTTENKA